MKKNLIKWSLFCFSVLLFLLSAVGCNSRKQETVTILYTNDVHAYIDNDEGGTDEGLTYAHVLQMKNDLAEEGKAVLAVDAGDHVQGSVYGTMDSGDTVLRMMNEIYDVATVGNHEFDYGMARALAITENAKYPYLSCNFVTVKDQKTVLDATKIIKISGVKVGFVGITTPEAISSSTPTYFEDEDGNMLYDVLGGDALYAAVQTSIDKLKKDGADYIIGIGHLGIDASSTYSSYRVIEHVSGLDALIDGHSHTVMEKEFVKDKAGEDVLLTQTGSYFSAIGKMTLCDGKVDAELVTRMTGWTPVLKRSKTSGWTL